MSLNMLEENNECWFYKQEFFEFTEEDKEEAINVLQILAKDFSTKNEAADISLTFTSLANHLKTISSAEAKDCLSAFLNPDQLASMPNIKSFIYIKKIAEEAKEDSLILEKKLAANIVMSLLHLIFYKALPCPLGNHCKHNPRKIVHKNDFLDVEIDCYFYHHEKDRRRFVLSEGQKEFKYAGNFGDNKKGENEKLSFSCNFFESLFHPLYYKHFKCVRTKCEKSVYCPYYHSNEEKTIWGATFRNFIGKDRDVFTKRKSTEEAKSQKFRLKKPSLTTKRPSFNSVHMTK